MRKYNPDVNEYKSPNNVMNPNPIINLKGLWEEQNLKLAAINYSNKKKVSREIVGISSPSISYITVKGDGTVGISNSLTDTSDYTTYPDRAIITLKNELGYNCYLTYLNIIGNRILKTRGEAGSLVNDELKRDDDIRKNGEKILKISNDYIFDTTQIDKIADYWYKKCGEKKHMYQVSIKGACPWYEPGDWYTLTLGGAGTNEYIDSTVEIYKVDIARDAGGIGSTTLLLRECMESWTKTTYYTARAILGGSPKRRSNQSNTVIVGSSTFSGTCDYRCDGTADEVQIQAAIDYLSQIDGGKILLDGVYYITDKITLKSKCSLIGSANETIIKSQGATFDTYIYCATSSIECLIKDVIIDGNSGIDVHSDAITYGIYGSYADLILENVIVQNIWNHRNAGAKVYCFYKTNRVMNCKVKNIRVDSDGEGSIIGFGDITGNMRQIVNCYVQALEVVLAAESTGEAICLAYSGINQVVSCYSGTLQVSGGSARRGIGFDNCYNVVSSVSENSDTDSIGFYSCYSVQQCKSITNDDDYIDSYATSTNTAGNECADTPEGGFNS